LQSGPPRFEIRPATEDDIPDLLDLWEALAAEGMIAAELPIDKEARSARWKETFSNTEDAVFFVARDGDDLLGAGGLEGGRGLFTLGMGVSPRHRHVGVGSSLLQACIDWARAKDAHKIALQVWPQNAAAIVLYEKFGFVHEGLLRSHWRRKNDELWDAVVMGLLL
jgi:putative acetyltransferase